MTAFAIAERADRAEDGPQHRRTVDEAFVGQPTSSATIEDDVGEILVADGGDRPLDTFDDLEYGDRIVYIGPEDLEGDWAAPKASRQPYTFEHVSIGGTLTCETRFKGHKYLAPEHPANDPQNWRRATPEEVGQ